MAATASAATRVSNHAQALRGRASTIADEVNQRADVFQADFEDRLDSPDDTMGLARLVRQLGGAAIIIALIIVVLNQVFTLEIVNNTSGPFDVTTIEGPTAGALGLLALAILVGGARAVMNMMGGGGGGL